MKRWSIPKSVIAAWYPCHFPHGSPGDLHLRSASGNLALDLEVRWTDGVSFPGFSSGFLLALGFLAELVVDHGNGRLDPLETRLFPDEVAGPGTCLRRWTLPSAEVDARYGRFFAARPVLWALHVREVQNPRKGFEVRWGGVGSPWTPLNLVLPFDRVLHHDLTVTVDLDRFQVSTFPWEGSSARAWRCLCSPRCSRADGGRGEMVDVGHACFVCGAQEGSKQWVW